MLAVLILILFLFSGTTYQSKSQSAAMKKSKIQLALLLDTSNSMDGLIDQAKSQLWNIVNELAKAKCGMDRPELQIALYEYGNDNLPYSEGHIRLVTPLTTDLDEISKDLFELTTNGGNEFCGTVIQTCLKQLSWSTSENDLQIIYIAGNEPFTQGKINYADACKLAKEKNVIVNTIFCGDFNVGIQTSWKNGADLACGQYSSIQQNSRTVYIESPYDKRITELNSELNNTYIPYGSYGYSKKMNQEVQDNNAQSYGTVNTVNRAVAKSSHVYDNSSWDLVDALANKDFSLQSVKKEELPEEMRSMSATEQQKYIETKKRERQNIQNEIQELNRKRSDYINDQKRDNADETEMLDAAILTSLREQAKSRNFIIE